MSEHVELESPPCPVCHAESFEPVLRGGRDRLWHKPGVFQLQRCGVCTLVMTRPRPTPDAMGFYYDGTYSGDTEAGMKNFQTNSKGGRMIFEYRLRVLQKVRRLTADDHLLDVGCSYGGFLRVARTAAGCRTSGIDLDAGSVADGVDPEQTDYRVGRLVEANYPTDGFTVVAFYESLEHHADPVAALTEARRILAPGGICVVEVPNFAGLWRRVFGTYWLPLLIPQHLFHFTPHSLERTFRAAGFEHIEHHQTMFFPLEGVASLGIWLARMLRTPPPGSKPSWRTPLDVAVFVALVALWFIVEVPSQAILQLLGYTGHQVTIARAD